MKKHILSLIILAALLVSGTHLFSQSISIGYSSPQSYPVGTAIAPLTASVTGGPAASGGQTTSTLAGGSAGAANGTGTAASFYNPLNTAVDAAGNVYVADGDNHQIRKITPAGVVTTLAGAGYAGYADGTGAAAIFQHPSALAVDASGNVFVSDQQNHRIRKVTQAGVVTTFAGNGSIGSANGTGTAASFYYPMGLTFDGSGNLYVADAYNNKIRKITPTGVVSDFAGSGTQGATNGAALSASFNKPMGIAFDQTGALYVADRYNHMVRKISSGVVSTLAGSGSIGSANGTGAAASFNYVNSVAVDLAGNVYAVDYLNNMIRKITPAGVVTSFAGTTTAGSVNGTGSVVRYNGPYGISIDSQGNLYLAENANNMIRKIATSAFNIYPNLPAGLSFNNANGIISGTPTTVTAVANYQIQAFNTTNSSNIFSLNLAVTGAVPSAVQASQDQNYVLTYRPNQAGLSSDVAVISASSDISKVQADIQYFDGLGRPLQTI
ncbi:putative Ig domain-containing protein, partial [Pedobacter sp.]|uniref:putative Ig domain-containing protein n=1 Tax=Pedobacter sp. TaxID=1411316 RepID=UPI002B630617